MYDGLLMHSRLHLTHTHTPLSCTPHVPPPSHTQAAISLFNLALELPGNGAYRLSGV
jgi:hypothetical protein